MGKAATSVCSHGRETAMEWKRYDWDVWEVTRCCKDRRGSRRGHHGSARCMRWHIAGMQEMRGSDPELLGLGSRGDLCEVRHELHSMAVVSAVSKS